MFQNGENIKQEIFSFAKTFVSALYDERVINKNLLNESEIYYFSIMDTVFVASYSESFTVLQCPLSIKKVKF